MTAAEVSCWMLSEIYEQPEALRRLFQQCLEEGYFRRGAMDAIAKWLKGQRNLILAASGSSRHAALASEMLFEELTTVRVDVEYASEFGSRQTRSQGDAGVIVVSQSGETADTLAALQFARAAGHPTLALVNVSGSSMMLTADVAMETLAGRELAIPATKSFTTQLAALELLVLLKAAEQGCYSRESIQERLAGLEHLPDRIAKQMIGWERRVRAIVERYRDSSSFLFLGRGIHYAIAREGALKLKESAYIHAEGYPAGELKHGPNALVSQGVPLVVIATFDPDNKDSITNRGKVLQLLRDMHRQGAQTLVIGNEGDSEIAEIATDCIDVEPDSDEHLCIAEVIPLQMFACFMAAARGVNPDRPRNLVKAVVAE